MHLHFAGSLDRQLHHHVILNTTANDFHRRAGVFLGVWQPDTHRGADLFHVPVSVASNELHAHDIGAASSFYAVVFGRGAESSPFGDSEYTHWTVDGRGVAGGMPLGVTLSAEMPPLWLAFCVVQHCDDMVTRAQELGATILAQPMTSEDGRYAVLQDPQGAVFGVISAVAQ